MLPTAPPMSPPRTAPAAAPNWYPDPWYQGQVRWWDGSAWTAHVTSGAWGQSPASAMYQPAQSRWFPDISTLRWPAAIFGVALVGILLAGNFAVTATKNDDLASGLIALALLAFYAIGFPLCSWYATRKWGSGRFLDDLGFRFKWVDIGLGIAGAFAMLVTLLIVGLVIRAVGVPQRSNLDEVTGSHRSVLLYVFLVVQAGILAPFTEELVFRGVLFRGLTAKLQTVAAIAVSAVIFGAAHVSLDGGWGNVGLAVALACIGAELAFMARSTGRLGAGMIAHGLFNTTQITLLFFVHSR